MHLNHDGPLQSQRLKNFALHLPVCVVIMPTSQPVASLYAAADFFLEHGEHEKSVQLLMQACQFSRALDVCSHNSITLTEVGAVSSNPQPGSDHPLLILCAEQSFCLTPGCRPSMCYQPISCLASTYVVASSSWPLCKGRSCCMNPVNVTEMMTS